mmetsp:Transcript_45312/g.98588  ORF Transcript_45312/g.98588 Transcript_45312/m.98588 type:complete len:334 (+) Transcript_45312:102-1103(+)
MLFIQLPGGKCRAVNARACPDVNALKMLIAEREGIPEHELRLSADGKPLLHDGRSLAFLDGAMVRVALRLLGGGGDGDQPDWTERGKVMTSSKKRGPDARAPDWHGDTAKYAAKMEHEKRERGELVVAIGPFCVPCGKRFAKQTVYDAHLSGTKHLKALERLGRTEEAMVCRLDVEAKKRKMDALEAKREAERNFSAKKVVVEAPDDEAARRKAEREEKLRQRAMMPMPKTVAAASVYVDPNEQSEGEEPPPRVEVVQPVAADPAVLAEAAAGVDSSYGKGMQDATERTNRFTSTDKAAIHRSLAVAPADWFGVGIHAAAAEPELPAHNPQPS